MTTPLCHNTPNLLDVLPFALLDELVSDVLKVAPSLRATFLASLGTRIHASAVRVLFSTLTFPDDARLFGTALCPVKSILTPLLFNSKRYAHAVKTLVVRDPDFTSVYIGQMCGSFSSVSREGSPAADSPDTFQPLDANDLSLILELCNNLEGFTWESSFPPPDGLCEMLISYNPRVMHFTCTPNTRFGHHASRVSPAKWDGPSLPLLSSLPLTSLHLSRLSQAGARSLSVLLSNLGEYSTLEEICVDFVWLDDQLCEKIVEAGGKLRKLRIGTSGTKLTDKGVVAIVDGCDAMEELTFDEVQGRLSRCLWTKPAAFPTGLKNFQIVISENGPHHSWTKDHLLSLNAIPFESLTGLSVVRREMLPRIEHAVPVFDVVLDDVLALKPVPDNFLNKMKDARSLKKFECDWWAWSIPDLKVVLESCPNLERLKICLDAPFSKLISLTSAFASLTSLHTLSVCVNPLHAPGKPPVPVPLFPRSSLPTPRESPVMKAKSVLPQLLDFDQMQTQTCLPNDSVGDPSMPLIRDVKRFVRKCLKLSLLEWYGKAGRGSWTIARPAPTTSKISTNVSVEYQAPIIADDVWKAMLREKDTEELASRGWTPSGIRRVGQVWTGDVAETLAAELWAERDREDGVSLAEKDRQGRPRESARKARLSSISTSSSTSGASDSHANQLPTPTRSAQSRSPAQSFFTPPLLDTSAAAVAAVAMLSSVSEHALPDEEEPNSLMSSVSESVFRSGRAMKGRTRSMTTLANKEGAGDGRSEWSGSTGKHTNSGTHSGRGGGSHKPGRGRGRGGFGASRKAASGDESGVPATNGTTPRVRARGGRGNHTSTLPGSDRGKTVRSSTR